MVVRTPKGVLRAAPGVASSSSRVVVAEGDSWFDLPWLYVVTDLLDCLEARHNYRIESFATRGDTLENMVYGTARSSMTRRRPPTIEEVVQTVAALKPRVFLFSGGGNDFVGDEFSAFLNHADSTLPIIRKDYVDYMFNTVFRRAIELLVDRVVLASPGCKVFMHGYGYAIPDGRGARVVVDWAGPWMLPTLTSKGIDPREHWTIISELIDRYNTMLQTIAGARDDFVYVDLRDSIDEGDWVDELHLSSAGYARVADVIAHAVERHVAGW